MDRSLSHTVALASSEVALGSIVHGFKIPFGGHILSLNQGLILSFSIRGEHSRRKAVKTTHEISLTSAALKALSPMGNRLGPMLAISMQGFLYSLGITVLGTSLPGFILAMTLLSVWGIFQPLAIAWIIFGKTLFEGLFKLWTEISSIFGFSESLFIPIILGFIFTKILMSWVLAWISWRAGEALERRYLENLKSIAKKSGLTPLRNTSASSGKSSLSAFFRDLIQPWFLVSFLVSLGFFIGSGEHGAPQVFFYALRVFGVAMLVFWTLRSFRRAWAEKLFSRFPGLLARVDQVRRILD